MNSVQFVESIVNWLLADPAHIVVAASIVAALTPTPDPNSLAGKLYRVIDLIAFNVLRAKQAGPIAAPVAGPAAPDAAKSKQAGFSRLTAAILVAMLGALFGLSGCAGVQSVAAGVNAQAVQATMVAGKDQLTLGREMLCAAPYQTVANAMAEDAALATALPALCPAVRTVTIPTAAKSVAVQEGARTLD
jgi:hypothetical protein